ncbi:MAG: hypothetical protein K0S74_1765 [Chlamydiales bacterium]|jgi:hypothetical protein|nr:hypothetical protein [Chlamydiales bacterium]
MSTITNLNSSQFYINNKEEKSYNSLKAITASLPCLSKAYPDRVKCKELIQDLFEKNILTLRLYEQYHFFQRLNDRDIKVLYHQQAGMPLQGWLEDLEELFYYRILKLTTEYITPQQPAYMRLSQNCSDANRFKLGKALARKFPTLLCNHILELQIHKQSQRVELALIAAQVNPMAIYATLENFKLESEEDRFQILQQWIRLVETSYLYPTVQIKIAKFNITDPDKHAAIVNNLKNSDDAYYRTQTYLLKLRVETIELYYKTVEKLTTTSTNDYFFPLVLFYDPERFLYQKEKTSQESLEFLLIAAVNSVAPVDPTESLEQYINKLDFTSGKKYLKLAQALAVNYIPLLMHYMPKFNLSEPEKFAIYKEILESNRFEFPFKNLGIEDSQLLFKLAKVAVKNRFPLSKNLEHNLHLNSQGKKDIIVSLAAKERGITLKELESWGIHDPQQFFEFALDSIKVNPHKILFDLTDSTFKGVQPYLEILTHAFDASFDWIDAFPLFEKTLPSEWVTLFDTWRQFYLTFFGTCRLPIEQKNLYEFATSQLGSYLKEVFAKDLEKLLSQLWPHSDFVAELFKEQIITFSKSQDITFKELLAIQPPGLNFPNERNWDFELLHAFKWVTYTLTYSILKLSREILVEIEPLLKQISQFSTFITRYNLVDNIVKQIHSSKSLLESYKFLAAAIPQRLQLPMFLIQIITHPTKDTEFVLELLQMLTNKREFSENKQEFKLLVETLDELSHVKNDKLGPSDKLNLLKTIFRETQFDKLKNSLLITKGIIQTGQVKLLTLYNFTICNNDIIQSLRWAIERFFKTHDCPDFKQYYSKILDPCYNSGAFLVYIANLRYDSDFNKIKELMKLYLQEVTTPEAHQFYAKRYNEEYSSHLKKIYSYRPDLKELWRVGHTESLNDYLRIHTLLYQKENSTFSFNNYFAQKLLHDQLLDLTLYPNIEKYFNVTSPAEIKMIVEELKCPCKLEDLYRVRLEGLLIKLMQEEAAPLNLLTLRQVQEALESIPSGGQLANEIDTLLQNFSTIASEAEGSKYNKWTISDTDHYWDLFLACFATTEETLETLKTSDYSKSYFEYAMDGKNRLLAIKDDTGKIRAFTIISLVLDGEIPVLYQKDFLLKKASPEIKAALEHFAVERAKFLNIALYKQRYTLGNRHLLAKLQASISKRSPWIDKLGTNIPIHIGNYSLYTQGAYLAYTPSNYNIEDKIYKSIPSIDSGEYIKLDL